MHPSPAPQAVNLQRRQTFRLQARKGQHIECQTGQLWITQDGDPRDVILSAHESFTLDRTGDALVSALESASSFVILRPVKAVRRLLSPAREAQHTEAVANCAY